MRIVRLSLSYFRNFLSLELSFPPGGIVLVGENAQGKTNLLEAVYYLALTRSPRAEVERELIYRSDDAYASATRVEGEFQGRQGMVKIEIALRPREGEGGVEKRLRVNGVPRRAHQVVGTVTAVLFSAEDLGLIGGAPALRRRFLDTLGCQLSPHYYSSLQRYERVLAQRNHLLRLMAEGRGQAGELEFWDQALAQEGCFLVSERRRLVEGMAEGIERVHRWLSGAGLEAVYQPSPAQPSPEGFRLALEKARPRELAQGMTVVGPHRDGLQFLMGGAELGVYGSRGEQRTAALALRLAEADYLRQQRGELPLVLLDDVLSELDPGRRRQVAAFLEGQEQYLLTTADPSQVEPAFLAGAALFSVRGGTVSPR